MTCRHCGQPITACPIDPHRSLCRGYVHTATARHNCAKGLECAEPAPEVAS